MNPEKKKLREGVLTTQIISASRTKTRASRPVKQGKRVSISHLLKPLTRQ